MTSLYLALIMYVVCVLLILFLVSRSKIDVFVVLIVVAFLFGFLGNIKFDQLTSGIRTGFGVTMAYAGVIAMCGAIIMSIMEKTGAILAVTRRISKIFGKKGAVFGMTLSGYFASIASSRAYAAQSISPLKNAIANESGKSPAAMTAALATGLTSAQFLLPINPVTIASSGITRTDLGTIIVFGFVASIVALIVSFIWSAFVAKKTDIAPVEAPTTEEIYESYGKLPNAFHALLPILFPLVFVALRSLASIPSMPFSKGIALTIIAFLGDPIIAFIIGVLLALTLIPRKSGAEINTLVSDSIKNASYTIAVAAAAGVFGFLTIQSPIAQAHITSSIARHAVMLVPFAFAIVLRLIQGSPFNAFLIATGLSAIVTPVFGLNPAYVTLAAGAGVMTISKSTCCFIDKTAEGAGAEPTLINKMCAGGFALSGVLAFVVLEGISFLL